MKGILSFAAFVSLSAIVAVVVSAIPVALGSFIGSAVTGVPMGAAVKIAVAVVAVDWVVEFAAEKFIDDDKTEDVPQ